MLFWKKERSRARMARLMGGRNMVDSGDSLMVSLFRIGRNHGFCFVHGRVTVLSDSCGTLRASKSVLVQEPSDCSQVVLCMVYNTIRVKYEA